MSLPLELRSKIFAFAEPLGDELVVLLCDCHSHELRRKHTKIGQCISQYRPPPALARPLLRVSHQVRAEAKDIVDQCRTVIACSILCAADAFKLMPDHELNMTKTVLIRRTLQKSNFHWQLNEFKRRYMQYIRDELQASHFETAKLIRIEMKEEEGFLTFEYEFQVGRSRQGASRGAEGGYVKDSDIIAFRMIRMDEGIWRSRDTLKYFQALPERERFEARMAIRRRPARLEILE